MALLLGSAPQRSSSALHSAPLHCTLLLCSSVLRSTRGHPRRATTRLTGEAEVIFDPDLFWSGSGASKHESISSRRMQQFPWKWTVLRLKVSGCSMWLRPALFRTNSPTVRLGSVLVIFGDTGTHPHTERRHHEEPVQQKARKIPPSNPCQNQVEPERSRLKVWLGSGERKNTGTSYDDSPAQGIT